MSQKPHLPIPGCQSSRKQCLLPWFCRSCVSFRWHSLAARHLGRRNECKWRNPVIALLAFARTNSAGKPAWVDVDSNQICLGAPSSSCLRYALWFDVLGQRRSPWPQTATASGSRWTRQLLRQTMRHMETRRWRIRSCRLFLCILCTWKWIASCPGQGHLASRSRRSSRPDSLLGRYSSWTNWLDPELCRTAVAARAGKPRGRQKWRNTCSAESSTGPSSSPLACSRSHECRSLTAVLALQLWPAAWSLSSVGWLWCFWLQIRSTLFTGVLIFI